MKSTRVTKAGEQGQRFVLAYQHSYEFPIASAIPLYSPAVAVLNPTLIFGPNDSSINRGDSEDTGDNEARPTEKGSGPGHPTVDDAALGGTGSIRHPSGSSFDIEEELQQSDGIEIMEATDGRLGLTNIDDVPADDWAADTGETKTPDGG